MKNLPAKLYKYYEVNDFLPKILSGDSLKFSCLFDFNDPFEGRYCYQIQSGKEGDKFVREEVGKMHSNPSARILEQQRIKRKFAKPVSSDSWADDVLRRIGIFCLREACDDILMWSHYANQHKGICIGFDTSYPMFKLAWDVNYQEEFPVIVRPADSVDVLLKKTVQTKAACWAYEKEWRIIKRTLTDAERGYYKQKYADLAEEDMCQLIEQDGPGIYSFPKKAISVIYLGVRIEQSEREYVMRSIKEANLSIPVYQARRKLKEYGIEFFPA